ncbi:MAG TPA: hypothetical protein VFD87_17780 [Phototrophicaceae bacterium]|nr:hypothetical protein [Phototrophicaceae bacterium]
MSASLAKQRQFHPDLRHVKTSAYTANLCSGAMLAESWGRSMKITFLEDTHKRKESFSLRQTFLNMRSYRQLFQVHEFRREAKSPGLATRPL